jgi:hypothetical protein
MPDSKPSLARFQVSLGFLIKSQLNRLSVICTGFLQEQVGAGTIRPSTLRPRTFYPRMIRLSKLRLRTFHPRMIRPCTLYPGVFTSPYVSSLK